MWCEEVVRLDMDFGSSLEVLPPHTTGKKFFHVAKVSAEKVLIKAKRRIPYGRRLATVRIPSRPGLLNFLFWWFNPRVTPLLIPNRVVKP